MEFCIFHGNFFQNGFPEFAHILQVEFLTVIGPRAVSGLASRSSPTGITLLAQGSGLPGN